MWRRPLPRRGAAVRRAGPAGLVAPAQTSVARRRDDWSAASAALAEARQRRGGLVGVEPGLDALEFDYVRAVFGQLPLNALGHARQRRPAVDERSRQQEQADRSRQAGDGGVPA